MDRWDIYTVLKNVMAGDSIDKAVIQEIEAMNGAEAIEGIIEFALAKGMD